MQLRWLVIFSLSLVAVIYYWVERVNPQRMMTITDIPLGLYIHFPWCVAKCPYCDFNSHQLRGQLPEAAYIEALSQDLRCQAESVIGRQVSTIFMGGGTPSLFSAESLERLMTELRANFEMSDSLEVTLEANPGTFERERFAAYRDLGINRLSLGVPKFF